MFVYPTETNQYFENIWEWVDGQSLFLLEYNDTCKKHILFQTAWLKSNWHMINCIYLKHNNLISSIYKLMKPSPQSIQWAFLSTSEVHVLCNLSLLRLSAPHRPQEIIMLRERSQTMSGLLSISIDWFAFRGVPVNGVLWYVLFLS